MNGTKAPIHLLGGPPARAGSLNLNEIAQTDIRPSWAEHHRARPRRLASVIRRTRTAASERPGTLPDSILARRARSSRRVDHGHSGIQGRVYMVVEPERPRTVRWPELRFVYA